LTYWTIWYIHLYFYTEDINFQFSHFLQKLYTWYTLRAGLWTAPLRLIKKRCISLLRSDNLFGYHNFCLFLTDLCCYRGVYRQECTHTHLLYLSSGLYIIYIYIYIYISKPDLGQCRAATTSALTCYASARVGWPIGSSYVIRARLCEYRASSRRELNKTQVGCFTAIRRERASGR